MSRIYNAVRNKKTIWCLITWKTSDFQILLQGFFLALRIYTFTVEFDNEDIFKNDAS